MLVFYHIVVNFSPGFGKALDSYMFDCSSLRSNMIKEEYRLAVVKAKKSTTVGDHIVLSQRFHRTIGTDPFHVYRVLGFEHPNPFKTYVKVKLLLRIIWISFVQLLFIN